MTRTRSQLGSDGAAKLYNVRLVSDFSDDPIAADEVVAQLGFDPIEHAMTGSDDDGEIRQLPAGHGMCPRAASKST